MTTCHMQSMLGQEQGHQLLLTAVIIMVVLLCFSLLSCWDCYDCNYEYLGFFGLTEILTTLRASDFRAPKLAHKPLKGV